jgi:hypothetical protein
MLEKRSDSCILMLWGGKKKNQELARPLIGPRCPGWCWPWHPLVLMFIWRHPKNEARSGSPPPSCLEPSVLQTHSCFALWPGKCQPATLTLRFPRGPPRPHCPVAPQRDIVFHPDLKLQGDMVEWQISEKPSASHSFKFFLFFSKFPPRSLL